MNQPRDLAAAELDALEIEAEDVEEGETFSPLDPEVEAPINAAVHFEEKQGTTLSREELDKLAREALPFD
jgi:hypothetical protein